MLIVFPKCSPVKQHRLSSKITVPESLELLTMTLLSTDSTLQSAPLPPNQPD